MTKLLYFKGMNTHIDEKKGIVTLTTQCPMCQSMTSVEIPLNQYEKLTQEEIDNTPKQDLFPDMSPTQREMFISNLCPDCQNRIFGNCDDIDDDPFDDIFDLDDVLSEGIENPDEFDILVDDDEDE